MNRQSDEDLGASGQDNGSRKGLPWLARRTILGLIGAYQLARLGRVSPCRFTPTCSEYAREAIERHGAGRGVALALRRLGRCRPGGPSGYDPIPE
ncbi:MAG: membrane protein insertion efficiency factor YidD [Acidimicrobiales bacterium]